MPPTSNMSRVTALCNSPQHFLNDFARRSAHSRVPNLLADEVPFDRASLDQVKNRPQRARKLEALRRLYVAVGQVGIMKYEDAGNIAVAPEIRRNDHVELRR